MDIKRKVCTLLYYTMYDTIAFYCFIWRHHVIVKEKPEWMFKYSTYRWAGLWHYNAAASQFRNFRKNFFLNICTSLFLLVQKINKNMSIHLSYFLEKRLIVKPLNSCESIVGCFLFPKCDFFPPILSLVIDTYDVFIFKLLNPDRRRLLPHNFYINLHLNWMRPSLKLKRSSRASSIQMMEIKCDY